MSCRSRRGERAPRRPWRAIGLTVALIVVAAAGLGACALLGRSVDGSASTGAGDGATGRAAPEFTVSTLDGGTFDLRQHRGRVVAVYAMAGWCPSCLGETTAWAQLYPAYHQRGLDLLIVSADPNDTPRSIAQFQDAAGPESRSLPWAIDRDGRLTKALDIRSLDQTVILDRAGRVAYVDYVPTSADRLRQELDRILGEGS